MQYVRSISGSVSKTWNSINPATLSGAIDVIVVELEDGSLACSPFHVRFGKFALLRPYEKKVQFRVNEVKQDFAMKLGEGGEAFFVFETSDDIPEALQTSPLVSPVLSPKSQLEQGQASPGLQEPEYLDLDSQTRKHRPSSHSNPDMPASWLLEERRTQSYTGTLTPLSSSQERATEPPSLSKRATESHRHPLLERSVSDDALPTATRVHPKTLAKPILSDDTAAMSLHPSSLLDPIAMNSHVPRPRSPPAVPTRQAINRAVSLSKKLSSSNIPTQVSETGDLMLDMTGYKSTEDEALRAEVVARKILAEELEGNYDIGALIGADDHGNLWIYSSEEAKEAAGRDLGRSSLDSRGLLSSDAASDPGYQSDGEKSTTTEEVIESQQDGGPRSGPDGLITPPKTPPDPATMPESKNYAKTLRLTSEQLRSLGLKPGPNPMSFSVNKATCTAFMYYWKYNVPIVISDIDGTITKSDTLGHVFNMIGRDWTHPGVAKLYSDIAANGYHLMYLTSRSVGQADTTRNYLNSVIQDTYKLPKGPVILSPDRTIAALRREVYLRKPEVFKMACLRDIYNLFAQDTNPFYAGFGNRLTDALSYRSVNIPSKRIFTINSNAEVSLDLLSLNRYKSSYVTMRELVDHFFPPIGLLVSAGGESFTDFNFWRDEPLDLSDFAASDSDSDEDDGVDDQRSIRSEDEGSEGGDDEDDSRQAESTRLPLDSVDDSDGPIDSGLEESMIESKEETGGSGSAGSKQRNVEERLADLTIDDPLNPHSNGSSLVNAETARDSNADRGAAQVKNSRLAFGSPKKLTTAARNFLKSTNSGSSPKEGSDPA